MKRSIGVYLAACLAALSIQAGSSTAQAAPEPASPLALATTAADRAAASGLDALAKGPDEQFQRRTVYTGGVPGGKDLYYVSYDRTYKGLPVVGGDAVVTADAEGKVLDTVAANEGGLAVDTRAKISVQRAKSIARAQVSKVEKVEGGTLSVLADDHGKLVYEVVVSGRKADSTPSRLHVYVNAHTGVVEDQVDDVRAGSGTSEWNGPNPLNIDTSNNQTVDATRPGLRCVDYATNQPFTKSNNQFGTGKATSKETGCVDTLWSTQHQWDMLKNWLKRDGINGSGQGVTVKIGLDKVNAYWTGAHIEIGHNNAGQWIASMDVMAHEHGHAIDQYTPGGAGREAGLGEATGDIFGALTEAYTNEPAPYDTPDYLVGESVNLVGSGPIRNMYNPQAVNNDPNCWSSAIPGTEVHKAAGPLNHWFYLLAEGSNPGGGKPNSPTCNGSTVKGLGIQKAGLIFYNAMLTKTSSQTHFKYRIGTLKAAAALDPTCVQYETVKAAWNAISMPAQSGEPTCTPQGDPDFGLELTPAAGTVKAGAQTTATVKTTTVTAPAQNVALTVSGAPTGVTAKVEPTSVTSGNSATLTVSAAAGTAAGTYPLTVTGTGSKTHSVTYNLTVTRDDPPVNDFAIALNPTSGETNAGGSLSTTVGTTVTAGESQKVVLSASGLPSGATATFTPGTIASGESAKLTIATTGSTPAGTYPVTVTGTGASATHSATYQLKIGGEPPANDFAVTIAPESGSVEAGSSATAALSTRTTAGSPHKVWFAASGLPTGATATFNPVSVESGESSTLTVATSATTPEGVYTITVTATGTDSNHTATYTLTVTGGGTPGCGGLPAWDASTSYVPNDEVSHNDHKWKSTWYSTGAEPGAPGSWAVWQDQGAC